ncbi:ABC transporter permease [Sphaerobacter thermophilus]|uniref:Binding-protein-dependent transport systems inner membrane component n=1 Tax=Sphaerobacter thermophilus (strain ATCC 49802 / DSM 20745 / KCCM 41009 / NCIMB 13125 / S 6022) TaxID=479434 RepID=D1CAC6_SPHTD|nr:proline/glycine betaine ABC transporter permease [Sphaerobacter thermophilus]ACZ40769.1 binding-protein-dependent transport systems inner membrane component [Sphaerobacter thermophilus DSM 20745]
MWNEFPEQIDIPLANWVNRLVSWLLVTFGDVFDAISTATLWILLRVESAFTAIPWPVMLVLVAVAGALSTRSKLTTVMLVALMVMVGAFGYWHLAMLTLSIIVTSVVISVAIGLPLGILAARSDRAETIMRPLLDGAQTMPSFVYLVPALMFFGLGKVPAVMATVIYAMPPMIRLTSLGIRTVTEGAIEAAEAYGATPRQILFDVQLPLALPTIMAGVNQTTMMALAMVVIASMIGTTTVGSEVLMAIQRIDPGRGAEAGLTIVALAIVIDRITQGFAKRYERSIS